MNIIRGSVVGLAGAVGGGLLVWPAVTAADTGTELYKRDERSTELALADADDDDDSRDRDSRSDNSRSDSSQNSRAGGQDTSSGVDRARAADVTDDANDRQPLVSRDTTDQTRGESRPSRGSDDSRHVTRDVSQPSTVNGDQSRDVSRDDSDDSDGWSRDDSSVG